MTTPLRDIQDAMRRDDVEQIKQFYKLNPMLDYLDAAIHFDAKQVVKWLLNHTGIDPNERCRFPSIINGVPITLSFLSMGLPVLMCKSDAMFQLFLENAWDFNFHVKDSHGESLLYSTAIDRGFGVQLLLRNGVDENCSYSLARYDDFEALLETHPQRGMITHYRKVVAVTRASRERKLTLSSDLIRQLVPFIYSVSL
jgi:hypothetical protein